MRDDYEHHRENREDSRIINQMYGTYSDILFVLFPFLVIALQRLWSGQGDQILTRSDLSVAAAILGGLAIGKFVLGLISDRNLDRYRERIVFFIALTLFVVVGPALILVIRIVGGGPVPGFVSFVQPILLIIAISLYTTSISISNVLTRSWEPGSGTESEPEEGDHDDNENVPTLDLPRRRENGESL